jgi:uncharacterized membrane protein YkgB
MDGRYEIYRLRSRCNSASRYHESPNELGLQFLSIQAVSNLLGIIEISIALMIASRPLSARLAAIGSTAAVLMFLTTLTFLFSLPGWEPELGGFPGLSSAGGFLVKDLILLAAAVWSCGEALSALAGDRAWRSQRVASEMMPQAMRR